MRIGQITKVFIVWCANCQAEELAWNDEGNVTKESTTREIRKQGWTTRKGNWYCPACSEKKT